MWELLNRCRNFRIEIAWHVSHNCDILSAVERVMMVIPETALGNTILSLRKIFMMSLISLTLVSGKTRIPR